MSRPDECKYNVIQFLEAPFKDIADYVCVPRSWVQSRGPDDRKVRVSYPDEKSSDTEKRVKKSKNKSDQWKSFLCVVKHRTESYDEAKLYIQGMISDMRNADNHQSSAKVEETPRRCARFATRSAKVNFMDDLALIPTSNNNLKSKNLTMLKRKALPDPDIEAHNKLLRFTEAHDSDYEASEPCSQALELTSDDQSLTPQVSDEDLCTQELLVENTNDRNSTENRPTVNPNLSETNHSLDPEVIAKQELTGDFYTILRELHTNLQVCISSLVNKSMNTLMTTVNMYSACRYNPIAPSSKNMTQEAPKLIEKERNEEKDDDDDVGDSQPLKKENSPKRIKEIVLPPEYDENDTSWTRKYRKPAPGLVELMPHTGVYVKALSLTNCKRLSKDCKTLARMLLTEIFTTSALRTCSWTGTRAKAFDRDGTNVRPGLNEHARKVLLNYVADCAKKEGWNNCENQSILSSIRNKLQDICRKCKS